MCNPPAWYPRTPPSLPKSIVFERRGVYRRPPACYSFFGDLEISSSTVKTPDTMARKPRAPKEKREPAHKMDGDGLELTGGDGAESGESECCLTSRTANKQCSQNTCVTRCFGSQEGGRGSANQEGKLAGGIRRASQSATK